MDIASRLLLSWSLLLLVMVMVMPLTSCFHGHSLHWRSTHWPTYAHYSHCNANIAGKVSVRTLAVTMLLEMSRVVSYERTSEPANGQFPNRMNRLIAIDSHLSNPLSGWRCRC